MEILDSPNQESLEFSDYAGFWLRAAAIFIDGLIILLVAGIAIGLAVASQSVGLFVFIYIAAIVGGWLYFALMESSDKQATFGKQAVGLRVTDIHGERISFANATGRHFAKFLSGMIMYIGYFMAGFTEKKQGLHDIIAQTLVVKK
jgi:uncharacterized RDD family membrane protein YckC